MRALREAAGPLEASIFVEALRAMPAASLAIGLAAHALLWAVAMQLAEPSPPPQTAMALALGREWLAGYTELPPLAAWISEAIYRATHSLFALRLASAFCVAAAGWILFLFARRVVGDRHGAIAVLLMLGVFPVAFPGGALTGDVLQMPLAAAAILSWWIAVGERNPNAWIVLGALLGAMTYAGPQALALLAAFVIVTLLSAPARAAVRRLDALLCIALACFVFAFVAGPRMLWLWQHGFANAFAGAGAGVMPGEAASPLRLAVGILIGHLGLALLLFLASSGPGKEKNNAPVFLREPAARLPQGSLIALAILPAAFGLLSLYLLGISAPPKFFSPLLLLGGIAAVLAGGARLILRRQRLVGVVALVFLFAPPVLQIALSFTPGWLGENKATNWPAASAAHTFTEIYRTRAGRPLEFIVGERVPAAQISVLSTDRPHVVIDADPARVPWIDGAEFKRKGGVVYWEIRGADPSPPAEYVARLPAFVAEAPLRLPWARGGGDPVRLGWAIVPPAR